LIVALVYLPIMGGVSGRISRILDRTAAVLKVNFPWSVRAVLVVLAL